MTRQLGRKPILAFGNSSGDYPMFEFVTTGNSYPSMAFCLLCDDVERELGNAAKAEKCRKACETNGWVPVSMRDDWSTKNRSSFAQLSDMNWKSGKSYIL